MHGPDVPGRIAEQHDALHTALLARIEALLTPFLSDTPAADVTRTAHVCVAMYKAGLELVLGREGAERDAYVQELKNVLLRYLEPLVCDHPPADPSNTPALRPCDAPGRGPRAPAAPRTPPAPHPPRPTPLGFIPLGGIRWTL